MESSSSHITEKSVKISKANLPEEIVKDIISRLPVKRVFQAQCLSKNFSSLTTDPYFVEAHLRHSVRIRPSIILNKCNLVNLVRCSSGLVSDYAVEEVPLHHNIQFSSFNKMKIVASCNGLVVLCAKDNTDDCFLWNPATNQCNRLPVPSSIPNAYSVSVSWGFGYLRESKVYKVVRLAQGFTCGRLTTINVAEVLSCGTNQSWRRLNSRKFIRVCFMNGITVKGVVYWADYESRLLAFDLAKEEFSRLFAFDLAKEEFSRLFAFDLAKEEFSRIYLPVPMEGTIMEFKGSLAMCSSSGIERKSFDLWVMKNEHFASDSVRPAVDDYSWEKIYINAEFPPHTNLIKCLNDHQLFLLHVIYNNKYGQVQNIACSLYDLECKEIKHIPEIFAYDLTVAHNFVESLVPLYPSQNSSSDDDIDDNDEGVDMKECGATRDLCFEANVADQE